MSTGGQHVRRRHPTSSGMGAGGATTRDTHGHGYSPVPTDPYYGGVIDYEAITMDELTDGIVDGGTHIQPGSLPATAYDPTAPGVPTDLALSSETQLDSDGRSILRLVISLTQPTDSDLYGSWVEYTNRESAPGTADWDRPQKLFIPASQVQAAVEGIAGGTLYYARARATDVQGNFSDYTAEVSHTTGKDSVAPAMPTGFGVVAGFRGFFANWSPSSDADLMFTQVRWAPDDGTGLAPDTDSWQQLNVRTSGVFVSNLDADVLYWVQVRSVDFSGNVVTSAADSTAVDYLDNLEAGWADQLSVTPTLIGAADVAFNSVMTAILDANEINADAIQAGTLRIAPLTAYADGIEILAADETVIGRWDETGLKIVDQADPDRYLLLDAGQLKFTTDAGATFPTAVTPDGINASSVNFGALPGGHNLILNSSFELSDFVAAGSTFVFTDTTNWSAGNRTSTTNITEGTALTMTAASYA